MTHGADATDYSVVMDVADWLFIDGTMDNEVQQLGDRSRESDSPNKPDPYWVELAELGRSIRRAGWDQIPGWPKTSEGFRSWPALGQQQAMRLTVRQWGLVVSALERWTVVSESIDQLEEAATGRRIVDLVRARLTQQGLGLLPAVRPEW